CHPHDALLRKSADTERRLYHRVERVADNNNDAVWRVLYDFLRDSLNDPVIRFQEIVTAHPRLTSNAGGGHHKVRLRSVSIRIRSIKPAVVSSDRGRLCKIQRLALRHPFEDVYQDNIRQFLIYDALPRGRTDVGGSNNTDFPSCHSMFSTG